MNPEEDLCVSNVLAHTRRRVCPKLPKDLKQATNDAREWPMLATQEHRR